MNVIFFDKLQHPYTPEEHLQQNGAQMIFESGEETLDRLA